MNSVQLKDLISRVLKDLGKYSDEAADLLMLTAAQESHCGKYIRQLGGGPALGIFQMEPATMNDIYENYLRYRPGLAVALEQFRSGLDDKDLDLEGNILFQIAVARVHFLRKKSSIPKRDNYTDEFDYITALAEYWKRHWNTAAGAGTINEAVQNYAKFAVQGED